MNEHRPERHPPSVDEILRGSTGSLAVARFGHAATVKATRTCLDAVRETVRSGGLQPDKDAIAAQVLNTLERWDAPNLTRVFNLTGTVLHTNLGRAVLPESAVAAAADAMRSAVALEFDLGGGARGERDDHVRGLIRELTGAEDAVVVNNNAAAVLLVVNTFGLGKETIVSRGELIEIGGSFRLPDIMAGAGTRLVEVGTTNRTHLKDYQQALSAATGLVLKAHTSNYLIQGFTTSVPAAELAAVVRPHKVPFAHDLGSGALVDLSRYGLKAEPTVRDCLREGADLVTFSGDKLLGGPQVGIIAGRADLVARIARNPLKRALRVDKMRLAALEATLKLYCDPDRLTERLPTLRYCTRSRDTLAAVAVALVAPVADGVGSDYDVSAIECASQIGSGALPLETLASAGVCIRPKERKGAGRRLERLSLALRRLPIPVIGHIEDGALVLDLRCLDDEAVFIAQLAGLQALIGDEGAHGPD